MRDLIMTGYCGKLHMVEARVTIGSLIRQESYSWKCDPSMGGRAINMLGSHLIDLVAFAASQKDAWDAQHLSASHREHPGLQNYH